MSPLSSPRLRPPRTSVVPATQSDGVSSTTAPRQGDRSSYERCAADPPGGRSDALPLAGDVLFNR
jgi:hypothetical protein